MQSRTADARAGVVVAEGKWIVARAESLVIPEELRLRALVGREIASGRPVLSGFERDDAQARGGEPCREWRSAGSRADDEGVYRLARRKESHSVKLAVEAKGCALPQLIFVRCLSLLHLLCPQPRAAHALQVRSGRQP